MTIDYVKELSIKEELNETIEKAMRSVVMSFMRNVTFASPVDTGRFRANWVVGLNTPDNDIYPNRKSVSTAISAARSETKKFVFTGSQVMYINNNLPYAARLNDGYSKQAGAFFVERSARQAGINIKDGDL